MNMPFFIFFCENIAKIDDIHSGVNHRRRFAV